MLDFFSFSVFMIMLDFFSFRVLLKFWFFLQEIK